MRRRLAILLLALLGSLCAGVFLTPSTANAIGLDCKESPTPEVPGRGLTGFFQDEPKQLPPQEDPFAPNAKTTIYEQYGYAGLRWTTYDLGCGPDSARAPDATAGTAVANWLFLVPKAGVAFTNAVVEVAFRPAFLGEFDPLIRDVSNTLYRVLFANWVPIVLVATGALLIWRARRADLATSTAAVGWALFVLVMATALFQWPVQSGRAVDSSITTTLSAVNGGLASATGGSQASAKTAASNTHESLLYQSWLAGTLGQSNSDTARTYGPQLFDAMALTWREARILRQDPARGKTIVDNKRQQFANVAEKVKNADPDAYEYLTGKRSETRVGYALLALVGALFALPFLLGAALIVLASFLVVRFAVMLFPAFATIGLFPSMRRVVTSAGSVVAAALINGAMFAASVVIVLRAIGLLLDPGSSLPRWLSLTLMLLVSVVMWLVLRPIRKLGSLVLLGRTRSAGDVLDGPVGVSPNPKGRHARVEESGGSDAQRSASNEELRSEIHTIAEGWTSARLPSSYQFKEPDFGPTLPAGVAPAGAATANVRDGGGGNSDGTAVAAQPPPSRNGRSAAASEANPLEEPAKEDASQEHARPPRTPTEADQGALPGLPLRRPLGSDRASIPLAARPAVEESSGPIYVPNRDPTLNNGRDREAGPVLLEEEAASTLYRPAGKGRAPTKTGE